jgi:hypothetical protein
MPHSDFALMVQVIDPNEDEPGVSAVPRRFSRDAGMVIDVGANVGLRT